MSWQPCPAAECHQATRPDPVELVVVPRTSDVGGFEVRRALPSRQRRMVGPFIFLDQMGPGEFLAGQGLDVLAHPHIGLATITYLFHGEILHRDSLGNIQSIRPGEINWMTAGAGIAHSERTPESARQQPGRLFGLQTWVALPAPEEEARADFIHHPAESLPVIEDRGLVVRVLAGSFHGKRSPAGMNHETLYADASMAAGTVLPVHPDAEERALYVAEGRIRIADQEHSAGRLLVLAPGQTVDIHAVDNSRVLVLGGEPMDGPRHIWWNFVSSRRERIEQAKDDWKAGRFDQVVEETETLPLP